MTVCRTLGLLVFALAPLACSPESPAAGGQTGDPGVSDSSSLDPTPSGGGVGGSGSCRGAIQVLTPPDPDSDLNRQQQRALDPAHLVWLDAARGLSLLDFSDPSAPRIAGRVPMAQGLGELHVVGTTALLTRRSPRPWLSYYGNGYPAFGDEAELLAIDLRDRERPQTTHALRLEQGARLMHVVSSEGRTRVYLLSDGGAPHGCVGPDHHALLTSYELLDGQLVERARLELGNDVLTVARFPTSLLFQRANEDGGEHTLSLVSLAAPDASMRESVRTRVPGGGIVAAALSANGVLRAVAGGPAGTTEVLTYDTGATTEWTLLRRCAIDGRLASNRISFSADRVLFSTGVTASNESTLATVGTDASGGCETRALTARGDVLAAEDQASTGVFRVATNGSGQLVAQLARGADLTPIAEARSAVGAGVGIDLYTAVDAWPGMLASASAEPSGLLSVPFYRELSPSPHQRGIQLFRYADDAIEAGAAIVPATRLLHTGLAMPLVWSAAGLATLDLRDFSSPRVERALDVSPYFTRVWDFGDHWVRVRSTLRMEADDVPPEDLTDSPLATSAAESGAFLEVVPRTLDPDHGSAIASLPVHADTRFARVGALLVGVLSASGTSASSPDGPSPTELQVFDLTTAAQPRRVATLPAGSLWLPSNAQGSLGAYFWGGHRVGARCLECPGADLETRALSVAGALVLRGRAQAGSPVLHIVDLRQPAAPVLVPALPVALPAGAAVLSTFAADASVFVSYRVRAAEGRARFYFVRIDLSDPARPRVNAPVGVPGQLLAARGEQLYTREFVRGAQGVEAVVHRLVLRDGARAEGAATHSLGERMASALALDDAGHLLVDLREPLDALLARAHVPTPVTDLRILDAQTLVQLGQARVGRDGWRVDARAGRALYTAAEGLMLVDLRAPAQARAQAYFPLLAAPSPTIGMLTSDSVLLRDVGAIKRHALTVENLSSSSPQSAAP